MTRKERYKKKFSSDAFSDSDDSYGPPVKIRKQHSKNSTSQSLKNITNICHANNSSNPRKIIRDLQCATSHNNNSTTTGNDKVIINSENSENSEDSSHSNSECELDQNENVKNVEKNKIESTRIKENDSVNTVASENGISTSEVNMLSHEEYEGNKFIYLYFNVNSQGIPIKMTSESK